MANTFNAITTGAGGIATTGDSSGAFSFTKDGGSSEVYIDSSGNVGIGTSSPTYKLQMSGGNVAFSNTAGNVCNVEIAGNGNTPGTNSFVIQQATTSDTLLWNRANANLTFGTNATERMRITSAGGVSFGSSGTAYGTSGQVLTSNGDAAPTWNTLSAVTSLNGQTGAITNTSYGVIGSYVIASTTFSASATINADTTVAGSTLNRTDYASAGASTVARPLNGLAQGNVSVSTGIQTSLGLSGTWRAMTYAMNSTSGGAAAPLILWVRIS